MSKTATRRCRHQAGPGFVYLGKVAAVQLKEQRLIRRSNGKRRYDAGGLLAVDELLVTGHGMAADVGDRCVLDIYHDARGGLPHNRRGVSIGLSHHYGMIQEALGALAAAGGGENIIIDNDRLVTIRDVGAGFHVCGPSGGVDISDVLPLTPCKPFAEYVVGSRLEHQSARQALAVLGGGMRGFSGRLGGAEGGVMVGAEVWGRPISWFESVMGSAGRHKVRKAIRRRLVQSRNRIRVIRSGPGR